MIHPVVTAKNAEEPYFPLAPSVPDAYLQPPQREGDDVLPDTKLRTVASLTEVWPERVGPQETRSFFVLTGVIEIVISPLPRRTPPDQVLA